MTIIKSKDNSIFKQVVKLNKSAKFRRECKLFIAEGYRIVKDAVESSADIDYFVFSESAIVKYSDFYKQITDTSCKCYVFSDDLFMKVTDTKTPQGVLCAIKLLDKNTVFGTIKGDEKFVALENIQDPGNMGTIFRTAEAIGINGIIMTKDCCDIYSPKVVRSTMGAVFRMPFIIVDKITDFISKDINSYAAVIDSSAKKITDVTFNTPCVCVIGNEGNGLTEETVNASDYAVTIPMNGRAESLNASVAASIFMWEMIK